MKTSNLSIYSVIALISLYVGFNIGYKMSEVKQKDRKRIEKEIQFKIQEKHNISFNKEKPDKEDEYHVWEWTTGAWYIETYTWRDDYIDNMIYNNQPIYFKLKDAQDNQPEFLYPSRENLQRHIRRILNKQQGLLKE